MTRPPCLPSSARLAARRNATRDLIAVGATIFSYGFALGLLVGAAVVLAILGEPS